MIAEGRGRIEAVLLDGAFRSVYQPVVDLDHDEIVGVEALTRFDATPTRTPDIWFQEAWDVGLGLELELAAIRSAIAGARGLPESWWVAVNASTTAVESAALVGVLDGMGERLIVEVTEHAALTDAAQFARSASVLAEHGVRLAIDDVGAGFSSLSRLLTIDPDVLKLDMSLTRGIDTDERRRALTAALVAFGAAAQLDLVAEGIETDAELAVLRGLDVRLGQGFCLGRPAPPEALAMAAAG
jgi:EAL domain-containing protein (putative c-di-GMP-specific phosphodiesterase class I)